MRDRGEIRRSPRAGRTRQTSKFRAAAAVELKLPDCLQLPELPDAYSLPEGSNMAE